MKRPNAITTTDMVAIARMNDVMQQAGQIANEQAARLAFDEHTARKSANTIRRKLADLALFEEFLRSAGIPAAGLYDNPEAWRGITWGIVEGFKAWQVQQGYAIGSINGRLSTVRTYAKIAARTGAIAAEESILIGGIQGYSGIEARHIDEKRHAEGMKTRKGAKKAEAVTIPDNVAQALKKQPNTQQGRRDNLIMCLLLDHGLRVGEIAILTRKAFDINANSLTFYRPKVDRTQTHTLSTDTCRAAALYLKHDAPADGILWRRSNKGTGLLSGQMSEMSATRAITKRVGLLGRHAGIKGLSAHDARHYWATYEANHGTQVNRLMDAGGWSSPAMPLRYIEAAQIANQGTARIKPS